MGFAILVKVICNKIVINKFYGESDIRKAEKTNVKKGKINKKVSALVLTAMMAIPVMSYANRTPVQETEVTEVNATKETASLERSYAASKLTETEAEDIEVKQIEEENLTEITILTGEVNVEVEESLSDEANIEIEETFDSEADVEIDVEMKGVFSIFDTIAVSRVYDYVNVRTIPSTEGEIVGKIYDGCAATILEVVDDWYRIESGSVEGYIKAEFFVTGAEAEALAEELATEFGVVNTTTLLVRAGASKESDCIDMVAEGSEFVVEEKKDGWGRIALDNSSEGWVSLDYLDTRIEFDTAISIEEEQAKLEEQRLAEERAQEARRLAEQEAAQQQAKVQKQTESSAYVESAQEISQASSSLREAIVAYALQFVGNPYVYGGNSLTNGTDCSGFVKLIYQEFGYSIERRASYQYMYNGIKISVDQLLPGDLVFYGNGEVDHVGMYIGDGRIVHASNSRTGIITSNLYYRTPYGAVRILN